MSCDVVSLLLTREEADDAAEDDFEEDLRHLEGDLEGDLEEEGGDLVADEAAIRYDADAPNLRLSRPQMSKSELIPDTRTGLGACAPT